MALDPTSLKQIDVVRLMNATPLGPVISTRQLYRHRERGTVHIGKGSKINLFKYIAWLVHTRHSKPEPEFETGYDGQRGRSATRSRANSESVRDIGDVPLIKDVKRRDACRFDLRLFCETYNPEAFYFGWSNDHLKVIERIEEAVLQGALYAFACPRGSGKTTICRMACLWAVSYAHSRYVFIVAANASKAGENLDAIKVFIRFLPTYAADFPEISYPIQQLEGIANRASGQLCGGESTLITWNNDRVALPTVPRPANWLSSWPTPSSHLAPSSGILIGVSGLTGDGIRGSLHTLTTGEMIRPDFVLLDDPQTDESARSRSQNVTRERLISGAVLGMAGPGRAISAVMPCTVIQPDDMVDRILDRKKHPLWRGERTQMLRSMPKHMDAWDKYFEVYRDCALREPPDFAEANQHYETNRATLDADAEPSWPERKLDGEVSAIQHAMNIYCRDPHAFFAEYQNQPIAEEANANDDLTAEQIVKKTNGLKRGEIAIGCNHVTAFIDVQQNLLFYVVAAWLDDFTGYVIDYGSYPDQHRGYFTLRDARTTLTDVAPGTGLEGSIYAGLETLCSQLLDREWHRDDGAAMRIERCLIDANWGSSTDVVYQFCRQSSHASLVVPSHGRFVGASSVPFSEYKRKLGDRVGHNWRIPNVQGKRAVRHVIYDTNYWKSFVYARLAVAMADKGCLSLFGSKPDRHQLFAEHLTAEYRVRTSGRGRTVDEWKMRPRQADNHWFDCLVGCAVAASIQGVSLSETGSVKPAPKRQRLKLSEVQTRKW